MQLEVREVFNKPGEEDVEANCKCGSAAELSTLVLTRPGESEITAGVGTHGQDLR